VKILPPFFQKIPICIFSFYGATDPGFSQTRSDFFDWEDLSGTQWSVDQKCEAHYEFLIGEIPVKNFPLDQKFSP
jgi:hypothetical protein